MWIGLDDTDSRTGGCTTYVAFEIIQQLIAQGYMLVGYPRLVRLNPQVPWKTRGNGAIAFQIETGTGKDCCVGRYNDDCFFMNQKGIASNVDINTVQSTVHACIEKYAEFSSENTNPAYVLCPTAIASDLYKKAVHELVTKQMVLQEIEKVHGAYHLFKNGRGIIGAASAISWDPQTDRTYELIAYRMESCWGTKRKVTAQSVIDMDAACSSTFNNYDYANKSMCIVPNSPCPILYGIRGDDVTVLPRCQQMIQSEAVHAWMIFASNQGTGEHLKKKSIAAISPYTSVIVQGTVSKKPVRLHGGHVIFAITDDTGNTIDCAAYEPTKQFRDVVDQLQIGDIVEIYGGIREEPLTVNIEKINIVKLTEVFEKIENPVCPVCGKHMRSRGSSQGYRCKICKTTAEKPVMQKKKRNLTEGFYEVPVCAMRHLSKPLKRMR